jgi:homoserine O-acetyltransferase/O-succinyltransferase
MRAGMIDAPHQRAALGDLVLESGERIVDCEISYVIHGELNAARDNVVLALSAIGANHHRLDFLIDPSRALDPSRLCVVAVDAIGNGLSTSPSNSASQPGMKFPAFTIRDMVHSQYRLLTEVLGVERLFAVCGASMGGMQALQWAVSHPTYMQHCVAMTPMARTAPWARAVNEVTRRTLMTDPAWNGHEFTGPVTRGWRTWAAISRVLINRTPDAINADYPQPEALYAWLDRITDEVIENGFDATDWLYQTRAYDAHDVGTTDGFDGDTLAALRSVRARTLVLTPPLDLYNPVSAAREASAAIPQARFVEIPSMQGHQAASALKATDATFLNREIALFLTHIIAT